MHTHFGPIRQLIDRGRATYRNRALGCYAAAVAVVAITAYISGQDFYRQGPMLLVAMLGGLGAVYHLWYRRLRWSSHPVLIALETNPTEIVSAVVTSGSGLSSLGNDRFVNISTAGDWVMLTFHKRDLGVLARALRDHCSDIELINFP